MKIDEKRPASDEKSLQLRRELLERIVRNEARRRNEQSAVLINPTNTWEASANIGGSNG